MSEPKGKSLSTIQVCLSLLVLVLAGTLLSPPAWAQSFQVIHNFSGAGDGANPQTGFSIDAAGNLYGTTFDGGAGYGTVFKLKRSGSGWVLTPLYTFQGGNDGAYPKGRVIIASDGTLYGTTVDGGGNGCATLGCGTVYRLRPPASAPRSVLAPWTEIVLYRFTGTNDGANPSGELTFDAAGNLYGTTENGGANGAGVVYKLTPSDGGWTQSVVYTVQNDGDGEGPRNGVVLDGAGNLYGAFLGGGRYGFGAIYELSPSGSGWTEQNLYDFGPQGPEYPWGGVILDAAGTLYGSTNTSATGGGYAFELTPAGGSWNYTLLPNLGFGGPEDKLSMDAAGNLYGTSFQGGDAIAGSVFELTLSNGEWIYTSLHDFCLSRPCSDGQNPISNVVFDRNGNLYGTTLQGGSSSGCNGGGCGVAWEITP